MSNKILKIGVFFLILWSPGCGEKAPAGDPELTNVSLPRKGVLPYFRGTVMDPFWPEAREFPDDLRGLRECSLTSHSDRPFTGADVRGHYSLVSFFFAHCSGICPTITLNMKKLSERIPDQSEIQFISITVDPERDRPPVLREYRDRHAVKQANWLFLTGDKTRIESLAREQFAGEVKIREGQGDLRDFVHTENVFLLDKDGYLRGIYRARGTGDFDRLVKDLEVLRARG